MTYDRVLALLLLCCAFHFCAAQLFDDTTLPNNSWRIKRNPLICLCSPSGRGYKEEQVSFLNSGFFEANLKIDELRKQGASNATIINERDNILLKKFSACVKLYRREACVNADETFRAKLRYQYCTYDRVSKKNVFPTRKGSKFVRTLKSCDLSPDHRSTRTTLGITAPPPSTPSNTPSNTPTSTPKATPTPSPTSSSSTSSGKKGVIDGPEEPTHVTQPGPRPTNEGCVAIEHLRGYVLQHRQHLLRNVLCGRGFCATPNHGIIVDGKMTSMKQLCETGWRCTETTKLVNNLKISANTRAFVGDIVVTPYDVRFPVVAIWAIQILEDVLELLLRASAVASVTSVVLLACVCLFSPSSKQE